MEEIRITSWYGECRIFSKGFNRWEVVQDFFQFTVWLIWLDRVTPEIPSKKGCFEFWVAGTNKKRVDEGDFLYPKWWPVHHLCVAALTWITVPFACRSWKGIYCTTLPERFAPENGWKMKFPLGCWFSGADWEFQGGQHAEMRFLPTCGVKAT